MRLRSLATSRELTLAALGVALLGLTGSAGQAPTGSSSELPSAPAVAATTPAPKPVVKASPGPVDRADRRSSGARTSSGPQIKIVDAAPRRPPKVDTTVFPARVGSGELELDLPVIPVGVTKDGDMELPKTVNEVGWYRFGAHPGSTNGTTVLAAHVDTRAEGLGPFSRLRDARRGDEVAVTDRRGRAQRYEVADVRSLDKNKIDWEQVFDRGGQPRLVLITCGGAYDQGSGYRDNVLVTAFPLS